MRTRLGNPVGHTRLPGYLRGRPGRIEAVIGRFPLADQRALGKRDAEKQPLYTVRFDARDVWGDDAPRETSITADLFESYLE
ncbi:MAG: SH3-like domain-containing protein [Vulcanimicrobiaceae bacterium]